MGCDQFVLGFGEALGNGMEEAGWGPMGGVVDKGGIEGEQVDATMEEVESRRSNKGVELTREQGRDC